MKEDGSEALRIEALNVDCTCAWIDASTFRQRDAVIRGTPDPKCTVHAESDEADRRQRANEMWWRSRCSRDAPEPPGFASVTTFWFANKDWNARREIR